MEGERSGFILLVLPKKAFSTVPGWKTEPVAVLSETQLSCRIWPAFIQWFSYHLSWRVIIPWLLTLLLVCLSITECWAAHMRMLVWVGPHLHTYKCGQLACIWLHRADQGRGLSNQGQKTLKGSWNIWPTEKNVRAYHFLRLFFHWEQAIFVPAEDVGCKEKSLWVSERAPGVRLRSTPKAIAYCVASYNSLSFTETQFLTCQVEILRKETLCLCMHVWIYVYIHYTYTFSTYAFWSFPDNGKRR